MTYCMFIVVCSIIFILCLIVYKISYIKIKNGCMTRNKYNWLIFNYISSHNKSDYIFEELGKLLANNKVNNCIYLMLIDIEDTGLYQVKIDNDIEIEYIKRNEDELTNINKFISNGMSKYQANHYTFIYSGHGDCFYLRPKKAKYIHIVDLNLLLQSYNIIWDLIVMDCCSMSSIECLGELQDTCNYLLALESYGSDYGLCNKKTLNGFNEHDNPIDISMAIIEQYIIDNKETDYVVDVALIDMKKIKQVFIEMNNNKLVNMPKNISMFDDIRIYKTEPDNSYLDLCKLVSIVYDNQRINDMINSSIILYKQSKEIDKLNGILICPSLKLYDYKVDYYRCWSYRNLDLLQYLHKIN